jgi:hypothetical protein
MGVVVESEEHKEVSARVGDCEICGLGYDDLVPEKDMICKLNVATFANC